MSGFNLVEIWHSMGLLARLVALTLGVMAIASLGVIFERLVYLVRSTAQSREFAPKASRLLGEGRVEAIAEAAAAYPRSPLAQLLRFGALRFVSFRDAGVPGEGLSPTEAARREMGRRSEAISQELRSGLGVLASVASVSPFVGLFGTVVGIITSFQGIAKTGSGGLGAVSAGIAEALAVTALGLLVAIPAVLCFNWLSSRIDAVEVGLTSAAGEFLDGLEHAYGGLDTRDSGATEDRREAA